MRTAVRQNASAFWTERRSREARRVETALGLFRVNLSGRGNFIDSQRVGVFLFRYCVSLA